MSVSSFQKMFAQAAEPWRTLIGIVEEQFEKNFFANYVVCGEYPPNESLTMDAWSIVGLFPGHHAFVECHFTSGTDREKPTYIRWFRDVLENLSVSRSLAQLNPSLLGGSIHAKLGKKKAHVVGMLSLHQTVETHRNIAVLWVHPDLSREVVSYVMKKVLEKRL